MNALKWLFFFFILICISTAVTFLGVSGECVKTTYGEGPKNLVFLSSTHCPYCQMQKKIFSEIENEALFTIEEYDIDSCAAQLGLNIEGTPAFILNDTIRYGVQSKEDLRSLSRL